MTHFLKRWRSNITPSDVDFRVTFSISMHSFSRGSPVRRPVAFSAWKKKNFDELNIIVL